MVSTYPRDINLLLASLERSKLSKLKTRSMVDKEDNTNNNSAHPTLSPHSLTKLVGTPSEGDVLTTDEHGQARNRGILTSYSLRSRNLNYPN